MYLYARGAGVRRRTLAAAVVILGGLGALVLGIVARETVTCLGSRTGSDGISTTIATTCSRRPDGALTGGLAVFGACLLVAVGVRLRPGLVRSAAIGIGAVASIVGSTVAGGAIGLAISRAKEPPDATSTYAITDGFYTLAGGALGLVLSGLAVWALAVRAARREARRLQE